MSFKDRNKFSMVATEDDRHGDRLYRSTACTERFLPVAALFGGNASGKTNFVKALDFVRSLVLEHIQPGMPIPVERFVLDPDCRESRPSEFSIAIIVDDLIYDYKIVVNDRHVLEERLRKTHPDNTETLLFHRKKGKEIELSGTEDNEERKSMVFVHRATRDNQLFLSNTVNLNFDWYAGVYNWFRDCLLVIYPGSIFRDIVSLDQDSLQSMLNGLDTGVSSLAYQDVPFDSEFPDHFKSSLRRAISSGEAISATRSLHEKYIVNNNNGQLSARKLCAVHHDSKGDRVFFDLALESSGTLRLIDVMPIFSGFRSEKSNRVCIIDEIDRSLHTLVVKQLVESFLEDRAESCRSQLIVTAHDALLMDLDLLRQDEIWLAKRGLEGDSSLSSLSDYAKHDPGSDLFVSYLVGRYGGVPDLIHQH